MTQTIREATFDLLRQLKLTTVFGNPGSTEETFLKNFPKDFRYVQTLQEASAVGAADGYAQATRSPALVNVHTSAGLCNAMSNILSASMNKTPLIITAGNQTRDMLLMEPWLTNIEPSLLPRPWVKWSYEPVRAEDVPAAFMRAYAVAMQPPQGPVFLSIPLDDWDKPALPNTQVRTVAERIGPDPRRVSVFADRLNAAKNPVLIYGGDIARGEGWADAIALAEKLNAPVWAAPACERPPMPENHPLYAGGLPFAIGPLSKKLEGHDVALVVGAPVFRYYPYVAGDYLPQGLSLLHVTDDPTQSARAPVGDSLLSDAVLALHAIFLQVAPRPARGATVARLPHRMAPHPPSSAAADSSAAGPLTARALFDILREQMPEDTVLIEESPSNLGDLHAAWSVDQPDSFYTFASGSLGWALPASVGLALAEHQRGGKRPHLAIIGDGSLQYAIQALWTAAQEQLPLIVVVPRNGQYGILKSFARLEETPGVPGLDLPHLDTVSLARGYGCTAVHAATAEAVRAACAEALRHSGPTLIEVPILPTIPPLL